MTLHFGGADTFVNFDLCAGSIGTLLLMCLFNFIGWFVCATLWCYFSGFIVRLVLGVLFLRFNFAQLLVLLVGLC